MRQRTVREILWSGEPIHWMIRDLLRLGYSLNQVRDMMLANHALAPADFWDEVEKHKLEELTNPSINTKGGECMSSCLFCPPSVPYGMPPEVWKSVIKQWHDKGHPRPAFKGVLPSTQAKGGKNDE